MRRVLLDAAEGVLVADGARGATVRAITSEAGVNVASVTTAFGGRSALLADLFVRIMTPINAERERRYAGLPAPRNVDGVIRAFVEPLEILALDSNSAMQPLMHAMVLDADGVGHPLERVLIDPGVTRLVDELESCLPELDSGEVRARVRLAVATILAVVTSRSESSVWHRAPLDALVRFVGAGLRSGVTTGSQS
ncbi:MULTISPECIES: TetR/AcrR family transcriptional regulator [unclassified Curtobacterium]|nr:MULTISPECIES: TetR/AcrR family transcriptional regulator [unclassified Curtobacterium]